MRRRLSSWIEYGCLAAAMTALGACVINPQPLPPEADDEGPNTVEPNMGTSDAGGKDAGKEPVPPGFDGGTPAPTLDDDAAIRGDAGTEAGISSEADAAPQDAMPRDVGVDVSVDAEHDGQVVPLSADAAPDGYADAAEGDAGSIDAGLEMETR